MQSHHLRTVVVDDEQLAREELCFLLEQVGGVEIIGQAANGIEALRVIEEERAGPGDARRADAGHHRASRSRGALLQDGVDSQLVFVTAFDQYAIDAFEVNAVDYLLKPVEPERLATAVERVAQAACRGPDGAERRRRARIWTACCSCCRSGRAGASSWPIKVERSVPAGPGGRGRPCLAWRTKKSGS